MEISEMETKAQYFDCLCRTCLNKVDASSHDGTTKPQQQWLSIFDTIEECGALRITELLSDAVPQIVVHPSDELPKKICTECLQQLLSVNRFQQMCVQSDKEMQELLAKEQTALKTAMLEEAIKCETETNDADSEPLNDLPCSSTQHNLQLLSIEEPLAEVTVQAIEPVKAQSSAAEHLQDNTQLLEQCIDAQGEFEEFIKNEPIEDDEANSEYSDGDTIHSIISVTKDEPIELEDQQVNVTSTRHDCHLCNKSYKWCDSLRRHLNNHKDKPQRYTCDFCNKSLTSSSGLRRHILTHTGERPYVCSECGKSFTQQSHLAEHRNIHSEDKEDKRYECPCCPLRFASKAVVARHKKSHEEAAKRYECDICGKKLRSKQILLKHKLIHSGEKPHKCDFCEKRFALLYELLSHNRIHTGEKPYKCKYCEHAYTTNSALLKHSRRHLGVNVYRCKFCPLAFPSVSEMRLHLTTHRNEDKETRERNLKALHEEEAKLVLKLSKERAERQSTEINLNKIKRHECDICGKKFRYKGDLTKHERIHSKPHKCDICEKRFARRQQLKAHKLKHKEAKLKLKFSKEISKGQSTEEQQQQKFSKKEIKQQSTERDESEEFIKNEPIEYEKPNKDYSDGNTMHSTISVTKDVALPIESEDQQVNKTSSRHNCHLCNKSYKSSENLTRHLNNHKKKANDKKEYCFACHLCSKSYKKQPSLTRHLNLAHSKEPQFTCDFCNKSFASSSGLGQHILTHTGERAYLSPQSVPGEQHTTYAEDKPYECPHCPLRFNSKSNLTKHKLIHEEIKRHKCSICEKTFRRKYYLSNHKRIHSNEKPHKCDVCEKRFAEMEQLKAHIRTHTGEKPYKCKYCQREFAAQGTLTQHLRSHLGKNIHRCKFCPLAFRLAAEMRLHLTSHKNEDPDVRDRNLKALQEVEVKLELKFSKEETKGQSREEHQQQKLYSEEIVQQSTGIIADQHTTHSEDRPYECPHCPLRFKSQSNLGAHKKIHEEIKRHECDICGKKFRQKNNLKMHNVRVHSREKPHKCDQCEMRFATIEYLQVHIRKHTGEKPYKCKYCESGFASRSMLSQHLRRHLGNNVHKCKFCPLAFPSSTEMRLHLVSHKNEDPKVRERNLKALQEQEAKLKQNFFKELSKGKSREEQQQKKSEKEIKQSSTERDEIEEFIKNEPIEDEKPNRDYSDGNTMHTTISVTKDVAFANRI